MTPLEQANDAWREGRIVESRRAYALIAERDPTAWGAAFQVAWMDAVFGRLSLPSARGFERPELGALAQALVRVLVAMAEIPRPLSGSEQDWDLDALRRLGGDEHAGWWEERARVATKAGLYGVALTCFEEAETRDPEGYRDPPSWSHSLPAQVDQHLDGVAHPFAG